MQRQFTDARFYVFTQDTHVSYVWKAANLAWNINITEFGLFATEPALPAPCWWGPVGPTSAHTWKKPSVSSTLLSSSIHSLHSTTFYKNPIPPFNPSLLPRFIKLMPWLLFVIPRAFKLHIHIISRQKCSENYREQVPKTDVIISSSLA